MRKNPAAVLLLLVCPLLAAQQQPVSETRQATQAVPATPPPPGTLLDGTPVKLRLSQTISSADARVDQEVPFTVVEDVSVDGVDVLPKGSIAIGTVTEAEHKRSMGRAGKLNISISYARLADQEKVPLRAIRDAKGGSHTGAMTAGMVGTAIVFFPAAPLLLFIHGKDITIPQGTEIAAFVDGDMHLKMSRFEAAPPQTAAAPESAAPAQAELTVDSTPPGADIEIDGAFVGSTPSTVSVPPGHHQITVKMRGLVDWTRTLNVTGGSIHLNAQLDESVVKP